MEFRYTGCWQLILVWDTCDIHLIRLPKFYISFIDLYRVIVSAFSLSSDIKWYKPARHLLFQLEGYWLNRLSTSISYGKPKYLQRVLSYNYATITFGEVNARRIKVKFSYAENWSVESWRNTSDKQFVSSIKLHAGKFYFFI